MRVLSLRHRPQLIQLSLVASAIALVGVGLGHPSVNGQQPSPPTPQEGGGVAPAVQPTRPTLQLGSQGDAVMELQALLKLLGYYQGAVDGRFQETTVSAVMQFQRQAGLPTDGIVGPSTWARLLPPAPPLAPRPVSSSPTPTVDAGGDRQPTLQPTPQPTPTPFPIPSASPSAPAAAPSPTPAATPAANPAGTSAPPAETASTAATLPTLRLGAQGSAVEQLQQRLRELGTYSGAVDGLFGPQTEEAVKQAQRQLNLTPDGVVGPATWRSLLNR